MPLTIMIIVVKNPKITESKRAFLMSLKIGVKFFAFFTRIFD